MKKLYVIVSPEGEVVYPPVYSEQEVYLALPHYSGGRVVEIYQLNSREAHLRAMGPIRLFLLFLIFLPICAALVLFPLYGIYDEYADYLTVNDWDRAPAIFVPSEITEHTTKHRLNAIPVGETSYLSLSGSYMYEYKGETYTGTRIGNHTDADIKAMMVNDKEYERRPREMTCYVNPANPQEACLFNTRPDFFEDHKVLILLLPLLGIAGLWSLFHTAALRSKLKKLPLVINEE
ncbi:MAG: DUF3592 domain-containing protein [Akkermansiaceae bacterium]|nr:DUF3592 domain-containing protein [Akkermansiaceae bacterium]